MTANNEQVFAPATPPIFRLLPAEIRLKIYEEFLADYHFPRQPPLMKTCKLMRKEVKDVYGKHLDRLEVRAKQSYGLVCDMTTENPRDRSGVQGQRMQASMRLEAREWFAKAERETFGLERDDEWIVEQLVAAAEESLAS